MRHALPSAKARYEARTDREVEPAGRNGAYPNGNGVTPADGAFAVETLTGGQKVVGSIPITPTNSDKDLGQ